MTEQFKLENGHPIFFAAHGIFEEVFAYARREGAYLLDPEAIKLRQKVVRLCHISFDAGASAVHQACQQDHFDRGMKIGDWCGGLLDLNKPLEQPDES